MFNVVIIMIVFIFIVVKCTNKDLQYFPNNKLLCATKPDRIILVN